MTIDTILFYDIQVNKIILLLLTYLLIDLFILKNMGIIDFRVCLPLVKCKNLMFSGFMVSLVQVSQYTVISPWNSMITPVVKWFVNGDIMTMIWQQINYLVFFFFLITVIFPIQNQYKSYLIKNCMHFFSFFAFLLLFKHKKKRGNQINILYEIKK